MSAFMDIGRSAAIHRVADGGVVGQLILQIHDGLGSPDEEDSVSVVQAAHLIRSEQLPAAQLEVGGVGARPPSGLAMRACINRGFPKSLRDVLVSAGLY